MIKNFLYNYFINKKISFKLMVLTLFFSAVITLVITVIQLFMDYRNGMKSIYTQISLIETGYIASISQSIWVYDNKQIILQLDGILNMPDIEYASIDLNGGEHYERGKSVSKNFLTKKIQLTYKHNSETIVLGELTVIADLNKLYEQLIDKAIVVLLSQGVKTFIVSFFILFLFQRLVTRHLEKIAKHTNFLKIDTKPEGLTLDKYTSSHTRDELDNLTEAINAMQNQIYKSYLDVSSELEARKKAETLLIQYKKALDASVYVSKSDLAGVITYVNDSMCNITGYSREELIGKPHNILRDPDTDPMIYKDMWRIISNKETWKGNMKNIKKDGSIFHISQTIVPILNTNGDIVEYISSRSDISELIEQRKTLEKYYETDRLTQLGNRLKLLNDINRSKKPALAIIDIDAFKEINDFYGNEAGDYVIKEVAKRLLAHLNKTTALIYRLHSDQFAFFCLDYYDQEQFQRTVTHLINKITNSPIFYEQYEILIGVTIGVAFDKEELFKNADISLNMAKKLKRNYLVYDKSFDKQEEYKNNLNWTKKIKKALDEDRIVAFFQPIYNQHTKKIEKYESLVRMIDVTGEIISPFFFLEISKKAKLYSKITMLMIDKAINAAKALDYEFSINLTMEDIINKDVANYFIQSIRENKIGHKIVIELVESEGIENFDEFHLFIKEVKKLGCKLAIDDFGTGYSNFEYLLKLDVDYIKIDGSLIKEIDKNKNMRLIAQSIVSFAKIANMKTIAEFVSHKEIADAIGDIDVDYLQGYYIGEPIEFDMISSVEKKEV
jgi:PAS domain S-box-containing protein/diguanylate cyclase (GGDEF)-like protein